MTIGFGIIGTGRMGNVHAAAIAATAGAKLIGVADIDAERPQSLAKEHNLSHCLYWLSRLVGNSRGDSRCCGNTGCRAPTAGRGCCPGGAACFPGLVTNDTASRSREIDSSGKRGALLGKSRVCVTMLAPGALCHGHTPGKN